MTGVVEADETFFRRSFKGQRKATPRLAKKRGGVAKDAKEGEKIPVLVALQRCSRIEHDVVLDGGIKKRKITQALRQILSADGRPRERVRLGRHSRRRPATDCQKP
ncbi:hypothetical protein ACFS07_32345 [Undibacterium arcticum]